jgi:hypothetical protein
MGGELDKFCRGDYGNLLIWRLIYLSGGSEIELRLESYFLSRSFLFKSDWLKVPSKNDWGGSVLSKVSLFCVYSLISNIWFSSCLTFCSKFKYFELIYSFACFSFCSFSWSWETSESLKSVSSSGIVTFWWVYIWLFRSSSYNLWTSSYSP